jgi:hypothetical protein
MDSSLDHHRPPAGGSDADAGARPHDGRSEERSVWTATGHESPVFLDHGGRRRRWVLAGGALAGAAAALWLAALVAGAIGFATLPLPRTLGFGHHHRHFTPIGWAERRQDIVVDSRHIGELRGHATVILRRDQGRA